VFGIVESEERENKPWRTATLPALILPGRRFRFIRLPCIQVRGYAIDEDESDHIDYSCCGLAHNNRYAMPPHLIFIDTAVVFYCFLSLHSRVELQFDPVAADGIARTHCYPPGGP
jgi:hypothetical protein